MRKLTIFVLGFLVGGILVYFVLNVRKGTAQEQLVVEELNPRLLLPDLIVQPARELYLFGSGAAKKIRFSTTFINIGRGPLELIRHLTPDGKQTFATQFIREEGDGNGIFREVGKFVYHPAHNHWHIENYVAYQIWSIDENEEKVKMIGTGEKMSFCVWDEKVFDVKLPNASAKQVYTSNCGREVQGMSVGWSDTYAAKVEGQEIDIPNLPDGLYLFVTIVNPDRKIMESDYDNNETAVILSISGNRLVKRKIMP